MTHFFLTRRSSGLGARAGVGHRQQVGLVELELRVELVLEVVARSADALTKRAAALDHETGDDPVEDQAVVVLLAGAAGVVGVVLGSLGKADEVLHRERSVVAEEVDRDVTLVGLQGGLEVSHDRSEEHTSELQSLMRISYAVFCLKK